MGLGLATFPRFPCHAAPRRSVVKMGGNLLDPETFAGLRFGVAALPFLPWLASGLRDAKVRRHCPRCGLTQRYPMPRSGPVHSLCGQGAVWSKRCAMPNC